MALCKQTAQEFIQNTFSPQVAVLCSSDADHICRKNNLSFVDLVQPFCRLTTEAHIRDPNNTSHTIHHLKITIIDMNNHPPQPPAAKKLMNDAVASAQPHIVEGNRGNVLSVGNYDLQLNASTPWFDVYREIFLQTLPPSDHEFLRHCLASMFVVSSAHTDPLAMFTTLSNSQQQQQTQFPNKLPRWFCPSILKYYVLLHDVVEGEQAKAEAIYQSMKSQFGAYYCHLLQINSRSSSAAETLRMDNNIADPWSQFLSKSTVEQNKKPQKARYFIAWEGVDYDGSGTSGIEESLFPSRLEEGANIEASIGNAMIDSVTETPTGFEDDVVPPVTEVFDHPLALSNHSSPDMDRDFPVDIVHSSSLSLNSENSITLGKSQSFTIEKKNLAHGLCLTTSDHDRLRIFIHEFVIRALIPWAEKQMRMLNDQQTSRTGLRRSIVSATKKWFGGNKPAGYAAANQTTTVVYTTEAPELQMRRLADLAFLFQLYEFAYQTYHTAKRDFNNDHAWLHYAGALEMACAAIFMLGNLSQRQYPHHYMESAITTYTQSCRNWQYATRASLISTEALKNRGMYTEAAMQFIKMMSEESDLQSALFLEQAAHCFINMKAPMVRKYAFHMILAGHRFSKAGQRKHALRTYSQAMQVYKGKNWSLAEDHINFTLGRQSHSLKQLENATAAFKHLLTENSKQTASQQNAFLREYLFVYRQLLQQEAGEMGVLSGALPELPLPTLDSNSTRVLMGNQPQPPQGDRVPATGVWFDQADVNNLKWHKLEELLVASANGGTLPVIFRPSLQCYSSKTENKFNPVGFVREPITVEIYLVNPLKVPLAMANVTLLWTFLPTVSGHDKPQLITNEHASTVKNLLADEIIHSEVIEEIILQGNERLPIQLTLVPQQMGDLRIVGLAYNLGSSTPGFSMTSQGGLMGNGGVGGSGPKASFVSTVYVRGKQKLEVQGPRLNNKKEEMVNKMYGPDRRLDLVIEQEMPLLQASFSNFPKSLLCGEVHPIVVYFTNSGSSPLHRLKVACSNPKFFTLSSHGESPKFAGVYHTDNITDATNRTPIITTLNYKDTGNVSRLVDISIPNGTLQPKSTISIPAWIRGDDIGGIHEVDFLFYYEPVQKMSKIRHRLLRHTTIVNTIESLSVRAVAYRACKSDSFTCDGKVGACFLSCEMENLSQVQIQKTHVKQIQIVQISSVSPHWVLKGVSTSQDSPDVTIGSREILQLCLRGEKQSDLTESAHLKGKTLLFTDIILRNQISSSKSPCVDFYFRSQTCFKPLEEETVQKSNSNYDVTVKSTEADFSHLNCAIELGLTLIILWQAHIVDERGQDTVSLGQHHVTIDKLDTIFTSYPFVMQVQTEKPAIKFIQDPEPQDDVKPAVEVITQLVSYSFQHKATVSHNFSKSRLCLVPVKLVLQNCSEAEVTVLIDTSKAQQRLNEYQDSSQFSTEATQAHGFNWVGQTLTELKLGPQEQRNIPLTVCFGKPGVYNINNLAAFVNYTKDSTEMMQQKHTTPSVLVVEDSS